MAPDWGIFIWGCRLVHNAGILTGAKYLFVNMKNSVTLSRSVPFHKVTLIHVCVINILKWTFF